jgi:hypothetical protein
MTLVLLGAKRAMNLSGPSTGPLRVPLRVGKPHGAEGGFDPHSAYAGIDDTNFFEYLCGEILPPSEPSEWVSQIDYFIRIFIFYRTGVVAAETCMTFSFPYMCLCAAAPLLCASLWG